jgi:hypothetical protein
MHLDMEHAILPRLYRFSDFLPLPNAEHGASADNARIFDSQNVARIVSIDLYQTLAKPDFPNIRIERSNNRLSTKRNRAFIRFFARCTDEVWDNFASNDLLGDGLTKHLQHSCHELRIVFIALFRLRPELRTIAGTGTEEPVVSMLRNWKLDYRLRIIISIEIHTEAQFIFVNCSPKRRQ